MEDPEIYRVSNIDNMIEALQKMKEQGGYTVIGQFVNDNDQVYILPVTVCKAYGNNDMVVINLKRIDKEFQGEM